MGGRPGRRMRGKLETAGEDGRREAREKTEGGWERQGKVSRNEASERKK